MKRKKVIILVLSFDKGDWWNIENEGIRKTWGMRDEHSQDVEILYYYGGRQAIEGDRLFFDIPEGYNSIGKKTLAALEFVNQNYDYDFIFRTNTSSYVDKANLLKSYESDDPTKHLYASVKCVPPPGDPRPIFASGCGYSLTKPTVNLILSHKDTWDHSMIDDLALAKLMIANDIPITEKPRVNINNPEKKHLFTAQIAANNFHIRCKNDHAPNAPRTGDIETMHYVHGIYQELRKK